MTIDEAIELGKRAILHATHRDAYSGGTNKGKPGKIVQRIQRNGKKLDAREVEERERRGRK